jgi:hypothetical protein
VIAPSSHRRVVWWDLELTPEACLARGRALWQRIKDGARREQAVGIGASESLERRLTDIPWERAQYLAPVEALTDALHRQ